MCNDTMIYKWDANNLQQKNKKKKLNLAAKKIYKLLKQILFKCSQYFLDLFSCSLYSTAFNLVESNKKGKLKVLRYW